MAFKHEAWGSFAAKFRALMTALPGATWFTRQVVRILRLGIGTPPSVNDQLLIEFLGYVR